LRYVLCFRRDIAEQFLIVCGGCTTCREKDTHTQKHANALMFFEPECPHIYIDTL
jgi:hypothetical protein